MSLANENIEQLLSLCKQNNQKAQFEVYTRYCKAMYNVAIRSDFTIKSSDFKASLVGSGDVKLKIDADSIATNLSGSGDIDLNVNSQILEANLSGSGHIVLSGKTKNLVLSVAGSGDIKAFGLHSENSKAAVSGSGNISTTCSEFI